MEIDQYQKLAARTNAELDLDYDKMTEVHMIFGMLTEVGELADPFKKNLAYGKDIDFINVKEELGDLMWYIGVLCEIRGWSLQEIMETNIEKLRKRYPEKFDADKAINRDTDAERKILEK